MVKYNSLFLTNFALHNFDATKFFMKLKPKSAQIDMSLYHMPFKRESEVENQF